MSLLRYTPAFSFTAAQKKSRESSLTFWSLFQPSWRRTIKRYHKNERHVKIFIGYGRQNLFSAAFSARYAETKTRG